MTRGVEHIDTIPDIIPARVNIHHLQLRDLLQPTGIKDKVLFVSRLQVEQADFASLKQPSVYCTLDFQPNCLSTGCGLLAAGGQHGELALRPLHSPSGSAPHLQMDSLTSERPPAPWLLRTPTGGSINNAITIQPDLNHPSSSHNVASTSTGSTSASPSKADIVDAYPSTDNYSPWARDEPSTSYGYQSHNVARPGLLFGDEEMESELSQSVFDELAAAYGFDPASVNRSSRWRLSPDYRTEASSASTSSRASASLGGAPIKVMVSNNDQSIKLYKLRPPKTYPGANNRIESGLPGLSRNTTLHFPTAINHASLSHDQRFLVAVGDTPEVFIHSVSRSGEHNKMATYTASSDACFSTTWSPDGTKFAVASQDGVVSVWDVRSSKRLAAANTSQQASVGSGSGAARVCKFSPDGRWLAFTEHRNFFHVTETITFGETQRLAAPSSFSSAAATSSSASTLIEESVGGRRAIPLSATGMLDTNTNSALGDRFRLLTGVREDAIARDSQRRSMIHATFMREWNRAINLVDRGPNALVSTSTSSPNISSVGSTAGDYTLPEWLPSNPTSTTSINPPGRREDLLTAALTQSATGYRRSSASTPGVAGGAGESVNISGMCWDPDSESIFVSTERCVAKYRVSDTRVSVAKGQLL